MIKESSSRDLCVNKAQCPKGSQSNYNKHLKVHVNSETNWALSYKCANYEVTLDCLDAPFCYYNKSTKQYSLSL